VDLGRERRIRERRRSLLLGTGGVTGVVVGLKVFGMFCFDALYIVTGYYYLVKKLLSTAFQLLVQGGSRSRSLQTSQAVRFNILRNSLG
jgi:hypothetical protein